MYVWDGPSGEALSFDASEVNQYQLGDIVVNQALVDVLYQHAKQLGVQFEVASMTLLQRETDYVELRDNAGNHIVPNCCWEQMVPSRGCDSKCRCGFVGKTTSNRQLLQ